MSFGFLNAAMLAGLGVIALPVLAHLLSKRRYDVVQWGAMQFLELGQKTRRRIQLQDLLLLLMRMLAVGLVAMAICRPWGQGGLFSQFAGDVSRDVVFVVDGSYSMGWEGHAVTPHAAAVQWIHEAIEELNPGDTAVILDARDIPRLIESPTTDLKHVREIADQLSEPSGSSDLPAAILEGMRALTSTMNVSREVIVLTDQQKLPWRVEDEYLWTRLEEMQKQPEVKPSITVVNLAETTDDRPNFSVDRLQLSRELTVPDFPIRLRGIICQSGGATTIVKVNFEVNGNVIPEMVREVQVLGNGEAVVEFEHRFDTVGTYLVSLAIDHDELPADNRSSAVVRVDDGIPVLIVDGDPHLDPTRAETFFVKSALAASGMKAPWVRARIIQPAELTQQALGVARVIFLCNVPRLTDEQRKLLNGFLLDGGGIVIAPGDKVDSASWNSLLAADHVPFLPASFSEIRSETNHPDEMVTVSHPSLQKQWLERFRKESGVDFCATRFSRWWKLDLKPAADVEQETQSGPEPEVLVRMTTGDPFLVSQRRGDGQIMLLSVPLDADWSTLPARSDFVPFLHELVFLLTSATSPRNVELGAPLLLTLADKQKPDDFLVTGPGLEKPVVPEPFFSGQLSFARFAKPELPGTYSFVPKIKSSPEDRGEPFVVNTDRAESNLTTLTEAEWNALAGEGRLLAATEMNERTKALKNSQSRAELWWGMLVLVLILLVSEVALTRRMVLGGHVVLDDTHTEEPAREVTQSSPAAHVHEHQSVDG